MARGFISCLMLALLGHTSLAQTTTNNGPSYVPSDAVAVPVNPTDAFNASMQTIFFTPDYTYTDNV